MTTPNQPPKRILGDLRIFQAIHNDLKLRHEELPDGRWVYVYDGVDPYELEDSAFPGVVSAIERLIASQVAEAADKRLNDLLNTVSRVTVVDHSAGGEGRVYEKWGIRSFIEFQDDARTLKVFIRDPDSPQSKKGKQ